ncbi:hypothetical protein OQA88_2856 [Cercophora sp. LCS_1]
MSTPSSTRRRPPSEFILPDGRRVLVALPEDIEALRQRYANAHEADPPTQVEVVVHGSDEHRHFLGVTKSHHETRHAQLREKVGHEVVNELDSVRAQLDAVSTQLLRLESNGKARLNTNFEKFGFDAKLRTYGDDEESGDGESTVVSLGAGERGGGSMRLFRRPVVKQYFHRGLLWRSAEETQVLSFELFFDLLYVGIIAINGDHAAEEANGHALLRFVVTFAMSWKIWSDVQQLVSWFETNDITQRVEILFLIACLLGHTTNSVSTFSSEHDTFTQLVAFYLAARLFNAVHFAVTCFFLPLVKGMMIAQITNILISAALWIASTTLTNDVTTHAVTETAAHLIEGRATEEAAGHVEERLPHTGRLVLVFIALAIDLFGNSIPHIMFRYGNTNTTRLAQRFGRFFEFWPAINIEHKVERTNAFVALVFGYSVVAVIFQNTGSFGLNAFLGKSILGLTQAFVFNWLYFEVDGNNIQLHAIRRHTKTAVIWTHAHLPFVMGYILAGAALCMLVVATDCPNASFDNLTPFYQHRSKETVSLGLRLYYCIGLGVALLFMGVISWSHEHRVPLGMCKLPKTTRLAARLLVCVILCCLPAAGDRLNSLNLVAVTTCLSTWVLLLELWGKGCTTESFFGFRSGGAGNKCQYTARCSQKRLEGARKSDGEIDIIELGRTEKTAVIGVS